MRPIRKRFEAAVVCGVVAIAGGGVFVDACASLGTDATGARLQRMERSPQWKHGHFENPQPLVTETWGTLTAMFNESRDAFPRDPVPVEKVDPGRFKTSPASGLRVTWFGHSSVLLEIDGRRILTDPVWGERASPFSWVGPKRWYEPLIALDALPHIDAVLISHDHYDHLDYDTIRAMRTWDTTFIVPLGVGAHLAYWGIPEARIVELDWWDHANVGGLDVVCTPARHVSGRSGPRRDVTLWAGYAFVGPRHRVYYSGDTGLFPAMKQIGERLGPFDLTMIEVGQYHKAWPDWHSGPEQAILAHQMVRGRVLLPVHWGLFTLAPHGWTEPVERAVAASNQAHITIITPKPGESVEPGVSPPSEHWWPALPWRTGAEDPIHSTQLN